MNSKKNYYEILKVSPLASPSTIKKSYQRLARIHHPDKNPNSPSAAEMFKQINEAYQTLSDNFKRKEFDRQIKKEKQKEEQKKNPFTPMYESYNSYAHFSGQAMPAHSSPHPSTTITPNSGQSPSNNSNPDSSSPKKDSFSSIKEFFTSSSATPPQQDCGQIKISLEEACLGAKKSIALKVRRKGTVKTEKFNIRIPPGAKEGEKVKARNNQTDKSNENLYVSVIYKEHPLFQVEGANVLVNLPVPFTKAILGGEVEIPTVRGQVSFQLPPGTHGGHVIQLKGQGFPLSAKSKQRGNMLITVMLDIPSDFSKEEKSWIRAIHNRNQLCPKVAEFDIKTKLLLKNRNK